MKKCISLFTLICFLIAQPIFAQDEVFYTDEDNELFNRGKFVGEESKDYLRAQKRARSRNWAIASGTAILGVVTLILIGQKHHE